MKIHKTIVNGLLLSVFTLFISCDNSKKKDPFEFNYKIVTIDGCEYFEYVGAMSYKSIEHKGNCKNKIHCYNK